MIEGYASCTFKCLLLHVIIVHTCVVLIHSHPHASAQTNSKIGPDTLQRLDEK